MSADATQMQDDDDASSSDSYTDEHTDFKPKMRDMDHRIALLKREREVVLQKARQFSDQIETLKDQQRALEDKRQDHYRRRWRTEEIAKLAAAGRVVCSHEAQPDLVEKGFVKHLLIIYIKFDVEWDIAHQSDGTKCAERNVAWPSYKVTGISTTIHSLCEEAQKAVQEACYTDEFISTIGCPPEPPHFMYHTMTSADNKEVCTGSHSMYVYIPPSLCAAPHPTN